MDQIERGRIIADAIEREANRIHNKIGSTNDHNCILTNDQCNALHEYYLHLRATGRQEEEFARIQAQPFTVYIIRDYDAIPSEGVIITEREQESY